MIMANTNEKAASTMSAFRERDSPMAIASSVGAYESRHNEGWRKDFSCCAAAHGDRILLKLPSGLEFLAAARG